MYWQLNRFLKQAAITTALSGIALTGFGSSNTTNTFTVVEDTYAYKFIPTNTYGSANSLLMRAEASNWSRIPYLKFNVASLPGPVNQALLHIYSISEGDMVDALAVSDNSWSENTLNWNNRPATGAVIGSGQASVTESWFNIDVSSYITSNGTFSIALEEKANNTVGHIAAIGSGQAAYLEILTSVAGALSPPTGLTATGGYETVMLEWDDNSEPTVDHYVIRRSQNGIDYAEIGTSGVSSFADTQAKLYETYYYTVAASDGGWYESAPSSSVTGEVGDPFTGDYIAGIESLVDDVENGTEPWRIAADARIDQYRKSDLTVHVVDALGNPVPGADVSVELQRHDFQFGCYMDSRRFVGSLAGVSSNDYQQAFLDFGFNLSGLGLGMKPIQRNNDASWSQVHNVAPYLAWCDTNNITVRGHTLIWPGWQFMPSESYGLSNNPVALETYCSNLVVQGAEWWPVAEWDVINEPRVNRDVQEIIGFDAETDWFNIAEANVINTNTLLVLNENKVISDPNSGVTQTANINSYMATLDGLIANDAPVHALGFQTRFRQMLDADLIYDRLNLFTNYNLPIAATEIEVVHNTIPDHLDKAIMTERAMTVYFSHPSVYQLTQWTFIEKHYNPPYSENDYRQLINADLSLTLQGKTWLYLMKNRWNTDVTELADLSGEIDVRGFKGEYLISANHEGESVEQAFVLGDSPGEVTLVLSGVTNAPSTMLVDYPFNDPADTPLTALQNEGPLGADWSADASGAVFTTGDGFLKSVTNRLPGTGFNINRDIVLDQPLTNGWAEFHWRLDSWDYSNLGNNAGVGFGLVGEGATETNDVLSNVVLRNSLTESRVQTRDANGDYTSAFGFPVMGNNPIDIRISVDLDAAQLTMEYSTNGTVWVDVTPAGGDGLDRIDKIYFQVFGADWTAAPLADSFAQVDFMTLSGSSVQPTPAVLYAQWLADFPTLGTSTNLADNPDGDIYDNLTEYYFGGDPTLGEPISNTPALNGSVDVNGTNYMRYVYHYRQDEVKRGLSSWIELNTTLTNAAWTNDLSGYEFIGEGSLDETWNAATNHIHMDQEKLFIRHRIHLSE